MKLTKATHSDIPELVELLKTLFEQEAEFEPNSEAQRKALSKIILDPTIGIILVARDDKKIMLYLPPLALSVICAIFP